MELSEAVVHVGGLKCVDSIIVKLRFAQIGETPVPYSATPVSAECGN